MELDLNLRVRIDELEKWLINQVIIISISLRRYHLG